MSLSNQNLTNDVENNQDTLEFPYWYNRDGEVPLWDDPTLRGYRKFPESQRPIYTLEAALSLETRGYISQEDTLLLKVLGDAICANENQLRRYLHSKMSSSQVSKRLKRFRQYSLADRWHVYSDLHEERPPAPFSLGIAGYRYLKYYYNDAYFMKPDRWDSFGIKGVQRYVSLNEIRCQLFESRALRGWVWQGVINNNPQLYRPMGVAEIATHKGNINLVIERPQMSMDYLSFLTSRLEVWQRVHDKFGLLPVKGVARNRNVVVIYASTRTLMKELYQQLGISRYTFPIWFCSEEDLLKEGIAKSFFLNKGDSLNRVSLDFLGSR